ncbi:DUF2092 domain-containing protein [Paracoccus sp. CPCC 101403]|uniref:DUF2092 domain-containing protein n=2 Tax=Paracoccus broussonetiae TaxID=3075834 RepID=A0ABU3ECZ8_9RHOB|nr:DUF2092 domain-containing protein [Paracoccus sp. CPCC 101403]MDT1062020.1 DUF2092 domain-containing protein [Paracoccus sp. CPCC 101403]
MRLRKRLVLGILLAAMSGPTWAEDAVEPAAIDALRKMGAHLATLDRFAVQADTEMEIVLDDEQKLLIGGEITYQVSRPDHLRVDLVTDVVKRQLYYDGKQAAFVAPEEAYYALIENPPSTIHDLLAEAAQKYALSFPAADLFEWGTPDEPVDEVTEAFLVGKATIAGQETDHWAFRTEDQDWEVWIGTQGSPLPLRVSLTDRHDPARPRYIATYAWTEQGEFGDDIFNYAPPEGARRIDFLAAAPPDDAGKQP